MPGAGLTAHNYGSFSVIKPWSVSSSLTKGRVLINNEAPPLSVTLTHADMLRHRHWKMHMYG